ncbi:signal peptidase I [Anaerotruncus rubiinfantis]|uniref:signal peptidase I n=3 Tax=Anaerotruncus rubiinfantis TaxID=1720200 RepID=UPI0009AECA54|nr:signal peptidase I [Anaerotruncus rubiinfantis]
MNLDNDMEQERQEGSDDFRYDIQNSLNASEKRKNAMNELYEWIESSVFAVILILLVFTFFVRTAFVSGSSMVPTLHDGERLILQQIGYTDPQYGDIIVIDRTQSDEPPIIKRVIGKEGDLIDIDFENGVVVRNGKVLDEPYVNEPTLTERDVEFPVEVPEGTLFVLGDNRNHSADSRTQDIGMIDLHRVMGKAVFRFFPLGNAGAITHQ